MLKLVIPTVILIGVIAIYLHDNARKVNFEKQPYKEVAAVTH